MIDALTVGESTLRLGPVEDRPLDAVPGHLPEVTLRAVVLARRHGLVISFDPDPRPKPGGADEARRSLGPGRRDLDLLLTGESEIQLLTGETDRRLRCELRRRRSASWSSSGAWPALWWPRTGGWWSSHPVSAIRIAGSMGAGDAFDPGSVAHPLRGLDIERWAKLGGGLGTPALAGTGDDETIPGWAEARGLAAQVNVQELEGAP
ncbi:MAG TPA: hypothetical protein VFA11_04265 [Acidimicrobiales bacterium]|jgi:2-dehydro-3-deoxygluconokinase|nr:hypothetical protein [Acidimicrobiales bacterium]